MKERVRCISNERGNSYFPETKYSFIPSNHYASLFFDKFAP
jgi:hypothetical protein